MIFPVFEGTSLYSLRLDHNLTNAHHLMLRANVSPSTVTGIEVNGENQTFGQNAYSRTSQQTYRDVTGVVQETWTIGSNKVNQVLFQYARRGLDYSFSSAPGGSDPAVNIPGFRVLRPRALSYIQRTETRFQFTDNFAWTIGRHDTKFGVDVNYIPLSATFTVNDGGVMTSARRISFRGPSRPRPGPRSPPSTPCRLTVRACRRISFKASAIPRTRFRTNPWEFSGRIPGACGRTSP